MTNRGINIYNLIFLLVILLIIVFYFAGFEGILFSDDYSYAFYAHELLQGNLILNDDIFSHRIGLYAPVAVFYGLFGVNDITTTLYPLCCFIATTCLIFYLLGKTNKFGATAGAALWGLGFYPLFFSNKLFPDVVLAFFAFATISILYTLDEKKVGTHEWRKGFLFGFLFFAGFLVKETQLYLLPFIGLAFIKNVRTGKHRTFWIGVVGSSLSLFLIYFIVYYLLKGNPWYRFEAIQEGHYISGNSYFDKPFSVLLKRITYLPLNMLIGSEMWLPILLAVPLFFKSRNDQEKGEKFWLHAGMVYLAVFWFGTTSLKYWNPITINPRMFIPVMPFWAAAGGIGFSRWIGSRKDQSLVVFLLLMIFTILWAWHIGAVKQVVMYGGLSVLFFAVWLMVKNKFSSWLTLLLLIVVLFMHPAYTMQKNTRANYKASRNIILNGVPVYKDKKVLVITDPALAAGNNFFYKFKIPENTEFINYKYRDSILAKANGREVYALVNPKHIQELLEMNYKVPPSFVRPPVSWKLIMKEETVSLFKIPLPYDEHNLFAFTQ